jgi:hypothetical protein
LQLAPSGAFGDLEEQSMSAPIAGARWYQAPRPRGGLRYQFAAGALVRARYLTADLLVDGLHLMVFQLRLYEAGPGRVFELTFAALPQCSARLRMAMEAVLQNRWQYPREGAWLKPMAGGDRVDLAKVDRMTIEVLRKSELPARFCLTSVTATDAEPPLFQELVLPQGRLLDELGQSRLHAWPGRSRDHEEVSARLKAQAAAAPDHRWPDGFGRWGGWTARRFEATGWFRTHHDGERCWLVDPAGHPFWSAGLDCVRPDTAAYVRGLESALTWMPERGSPFAAALGERRGGAYVNYLVANLIRAFGPEHWRERWASLALGELRRLGFNTVGNWSEWDIARAAAFPYVRPLSFEFRETALVFRDFPDVFHPAFERDARTFAAQLEATRDDPALIGYFLMNEPTWGFAKETPAAGMLHAPAGSATRRAFSDFLRQRYPDESALAATWGTGITFAALSDSEWRQAIPAAARKDLADFSEVMVERFFGTLSRACRQVDPHHLNLGIRYAGVPPAWALPGMRHFDVFSLNCYDRRVRAADMERIFTALRLPILVGEWHFGALDVGLPASGIGHVRHQLDRGKAFRIYTEDAAAKPWCVGVHYFIMYDQSALGRFDGECYNIGFYDVCHRPYEALADAARRSHERIYTLATGQAQPYAEEPEYLPLLFL